MTTCERCGNEMPDNLAICPNCGTVTSKAKGNVSPTTSYGTYSDRYYSQSPIYAENIQRDNVTPHSQEYNLQQQIYSYGQSYHSHPMYQQAPFHSTGFNTHNSTPLIVELLLSIFLGYLWYWLADGWRGRYRYHLTCLQPLHIFTSTHNIDLYRLLHIWLQSLLHRSYGHRSYHPQCNTSE